MSSPELDKTIYHRIGQFRELCRQIVANSEDCGEYRSGLFRYQDTAVQITFDHAPENTGFDSVAYLYGAPLKDDEDRWALPVNIYTLDNRGSLQRSFDLTTDQSIIERVVSERVKDLLDLPPIENGTIPAELIEIIDRDPGRLGTMLDEALLDAIRGPKIPQRLAHKIGSGAINLIELDKILEILSAIKTAPVEIS